MKPKYFKQRGKHTCSLAVLRSVLSAHGISVTEKDLVNKVNHDYGSGFTNIWNPTIAKLATSYGISTHLYAKWLLLKRNEIDRADEDYKKNPKGFNFARYEGSSDDDQISESLAIAYRDTFQAYNNGCQVTYGGITPDRIARAITKHQLIQTSIRLNRLYAGQSNAFHSVLLFDMKEGDVIYHDPLLGPDLHAPIERMVQAASNVGAFMIYG